MGINLNIWINKKDVPKLLGIQSQEFSDWNDFYFLLENNLIRWYVFQEIFGLEPDDYQPRTSKQLLEHLAKINKKIKNRERWVEILIKYDLIFAPDTYQEIPSDYIEVFDLEENIQKLTKQHFDEVVK